TPPSACLSLKLWDSSDREKGNLGHHPICATEPRGEPKLHRADEVQLCAQALCLEEMTGQAVPQGALFYATTKRRVTVPFDADLRALTEATVAELAAVLSSGVTPPPTLHRSRCRACSLAELCRPDNVARPVRAWRRRQVESAIAAVAP
uniref:CRISPR-associated protein Cas4 n=1 Tax=Paracoccus endophyticus TaxID=2233774 RepID=UPI000DD5FFED